MAWLDDHIDDELSSIDSDELMDISTEYTNLFVNIFNKVAESHDLNQGLLSTDAQINIAAFAFTHACEKYKEQF